jgi:hypothetical protein
MLEQAIASYPHRDLTILPGPVFYPLIALKNRHLRLTAEEKHYYSSMLENHCYPAESYAVHYWAGTWYSGGVAGALARFGVRVRTAIRASLKAGAGRLSRPAGDNDSGNVHKT